MKINMPEIFWGVIAASVIFDLILIIKACYA